MNAAEPARIDFVVEVFRDEEGSGKLEGWHPSLDKARHPNVEEARAYKSTRDPGMRYRIVKEILTREVVG